MFIYLTYNIVIAKAGVGLLSYLLLCLLFIQDMFFAFPYIIFAFHISKMSLFLFFVSICLYYLITPLPYFLVVALNITKSIFKWLDFTFTFCHFTYNERIVRQYSVHPRAAVVVHFTCICVMNPIHIAISFASNSEFIFSGTPILFYRFKFSLGFIFLLWKNLSLRFLFFCLKSFEFIALKFT